MSAVMRTSGVYVRELKVGKRGPDVREREEEEEEVDEVEGVEVLFGLNTIPSFGSVKFILSESSRYMSLIYITKREIAM